MSKETTELFILLNSNKLKELKGALSKDKVNARGASAQTLLHIAVSRSNADAVALLLELGANPNAYDGNGDTALIYATSSYQFDITRLLLNAGADPNLKGRKGMTALRWAITGGVDAYDLVRLLLHHGADPWIENEAGSHTVAYAEQLDPIFADEIRHTRPKVN